MLDFLHALVNVFAPGRSNSKIYLLSICLVCFGLFFIYRKNKPQQYEKAEKTFFLSLMAGLLLGLVIFIFFFVQHHIPINDFVVIFNQQEISSTKLIHNHFLKGSIGLIMQNFSNGQFENMDAGLPFLNLIPNILIWLGLVLIMLSLGSVIIMIKTEKKDRRKWQNILYILAFTILTFSLIKNVPDGGIFSAETLPLLFIALIFISHKAKESKKRLAGSVFFLYLVTAVCLISFNFFPTIIDFIHYLKSGFTAAWTLGIMFYLSEKSTLKRIDYLLIILTLLILSKPIIVELRELKDYTQKSAKDGIVALYHPPHQNLEMIGKINQLNFYKIDLPISIKDIANNEKLLDSIYPVAVPWLTCQPNSNLDIYNFTVQAERKNETFTSKFLIGEINQQNDTYSVTIKIKPCLPRHLNIINEYLQTNFKEPIIIYNLTSNLQ